MGKNERPKLKWMIVLAAVTRAICAYDSLGRGLSLVEIQDVVREAALRSGASENLLAVLLHHLPKLLWDVQMPDTESREAQISVSLKPQYEVWVGGEHKIVDDISKYEETKNEIDCWVSLDEKRHTSHKDRKKSIGPVSINLLIYLIEHIGKRVPFKQVLKDLWNAEPGDNFDTAQSQKNRLEVQLTKLEQFCGGKFRDYLFADKFNKGLGISKAFSDKYFVFRRLS